MDTGEERVFARSPAEQASSYLDKNFEDALLVFQKSAATPMGLMAPLRQKPGCLAIRRSTI
jgi:hypothetical protein